MKFVCFLIAVALAVALAGCSRKPAYSDVETGRRPSPESANANAQPAEQTATAAETPAPSASIAPAGGPSQPGREVKMPSFLDNGRNEPKDLPNYPGGRISGVQYGPAGGNNAFTITLKTKDPMDQIAAFYEKVVKTNKWTVTDKTRDPDMSEWVLKKGTGDEARVRVLKEASTGLFNIIVARIEPIREGQK